MIQLKERKIFYKLKYISLITKLSKKFIKELNLVLLYGIFNKYSSEPCMSAGKLITVLDMTLKGINGV